MDIDVVPRSTTDQIIVLDDIDDIDDIAVVDTGIEILPDSSTADLHDEAPGEQVTPPVVGDEVLDGFQDPIMPFVIIGMISLVAIFAIALLLAL